MALRFRANKPVAGDRGHIARFGVVGALGFLADAGGLYLLTRMGGDPYAMRLISFALAVTLTWWLNRRWTFRAAPAARRGSEYLTYLAVQLCGAAANYALFAMVLYWITPSPAHSVLALAVGSVAGLVVNYSGARFIVFAPGRAQA